MSVATNGTRDEQALRNWLARLGGLIDLVERCARADDWSTRRIEARLHESRFGTYEAPALLMQHETVRLLLEPIAGDVVGANGAVDLYVMPKYDDVANIWHAQGEWRLRHHHPGAALAGCGQEGPANLDDDTEDDSAPLTEESLHRVLEEMKHHAAVLS